MAEPTVELFREDANLRETGAVVTAARPEGLVLDRTVFYPTGGGQPGDRGALRLADGTTIAVVDTRWIDGELVHVVAEGSAAPTIGTPVTASLDWATRYGRMRVHSCLHLLCRAVDEAVTGGQIG
ncbi:MAG: alanine--tRNA ligase-related protein, partial [Pseudomonadota bacterium]